MLSTIQATELDVFRIQVYLSKIKYGGISFRVLFKDVALTTFYWVIMSIICHRAIQSEELSAIINLTLMHLYAILLLDYPTDNLISYSGGDSR